MPAIQGINDKLERVAVANDLAGYLGVDSGLVLERFRKDAADRVAGRGRQRGGRNPGRVEKVSGEAMEAPLATPARLTVYDAPLLVDSITPQMRENLDDELTEVKSENAVDRITSQANPRTLERVPAGAKFKFRIVLDVLCTEDKPLLARVAEGLRLLEDDALGGGGSRGNGRVSFAALSLAWRSQDYYAKGATEQSLLSASNLAALQQLASAADFAEKLA